jgi:hypothetical protein
MIKMNKDFSDEPQTCMKLSSTVYLLGTLIDADKKTLKKNNTLVLETLFMPAGN